MASAFTFSESHGTGPTTVDTDYLNLLSANIASGTDATTVPAANTILIPAAGSSYSYERWCQGHWTGTFTAVSNVYFWKSAGTPGTGCTLNSGDKGDKTFVTPVNTASSIATAGIPTTQGTGHTLAGTTGAGYSDYVVIQLVVGTTAGQGAGATMTYAMQWDET